MALPESGPDEPKEQKVPVGHDRAQENDERRKFPFQVKESASRNDRQTKRLLSLSIYLKGEPLVSLFPLTW